jgi:hypothetical protein
MNVLTGRMNITLTPTSPVQSLETGISLLMESDFLSVTDNS